jgi:hypothetical protein
MLDLDAIQARSDAATKGPWIQDQDPDGDESGIAGWRPSRDIKEVYRLPNGDVDVDDLMSAATPADAEFIAHAREDVPDLVAELHAAREVIAVARDAFPQVWEGPMRERCRAVLAAYDKATGEANHG